MGPLYSQIGRMKGVSVYKPGVNEPVELKEALGLIKQGKLKEAVKILNALQSNRYQSKRKLSREAQILIFDCYKKLAEKDKNYVDKAKSAYTILKSLPLVPAQIKNIEEGYRDLSDPVEEQGKAEGKERTGELFTESPEKGKAEAAPPKYEFLPETVHKKPVEVETRADVTDLAQAYVFLKEGKFDDAVEAGQDIKERVFGKKYPELSVNGRESLLEEVQDIIISAERYSVLFSKLSKHYKAGQHEKAYALAKELQHKYPGGFKKQGLALAVIVAKSAVELAQVSKESKEVFTYLREAKDIFDDILDEEGSFAEDELSDGLVAEINQQLHTIQLYAQGQTVTDALALMKQAQSIELSTVAYSITYGKRMDKLEDAKELLLRLPKDYSPEVLAECKREILATRTYVQFHLREYDEALENAKKLHSSYREKNNGKFDVSYVYLIGRIYERQGAPEKAIVALERIVDGKAMADKYSLYSGLISKTLGKLKERASLKNRVDNGIKRLKARNGYGSYISFYKNLFNGLFAEGKYNEARSQLRFFEQTAGTA